MEYPYFPVTAAQPYQFLGLPPTPSHTNSARSEDFSNSPPDAFDTYQAFDPFSHYNNTHNGIPKAASPMSQGKAVMSGNGSLLSQNFEMVSEVNDDTAKRGSNSDDDESNAGKSRRKAQNRAAQRAFRERKERHVKELEAKLADAEKASAQATSENERLRLQLQRAATENEILKATSSSSRSGSHSRVEPAISAGPMRFSPTDFYSEVLYAHENKIPSHRIVTSPETGERLLAAGATWDYIVQHPLYQQGRVDIGRVSEILKTLAKCDGQGPVFEEGAINRAIEAGVASGNDELL